MTSSLRAVVPLWAVSRAFALGTVAVAATLADRPFADLLRQWDGGWFLHVASNGYGREAHSAAFYPLYPAVLRAGGEILGDRPLLAGFLISFPLTLAGIFGVYAVAASRLAAPVARRAVLYLALFPTGFYLHALYSEALFLVLAACAFLAMDRSRHWTAGLLAGAAMLTRPLGAALLVGLLVSAASGPARWRAVSRLALAPIIFSSFPVILVASGREPLDFLGAESHWRDTSLDGFLRGPYLALTAAWNGGQALLSGYDYVALLNLTAFLVLVVFAVLAIVAGRLLGAGYGVYCLVALALPLATSADPWPLVSIQRFVLVLFPCFVALAALPLPRPVHCSLLAASGGAMVHLAIYWARGDFVA